MPQLRIPSNIMHIMCRTSVTLAHSKIENRVQVSATDMMTKREKSRSLSEAKSKEYLQIRLYIMLYGATMRNVSLHSLPHERKLMII